MKVELNYSARNISGPNNAHAHEIDRHAPSSHSPGDREQQLEILHRQQWQRRSSDNDSDNTERERLHGDWHIPSSNDYTDEEKSEKCLRSDGYS
ncbi:hypothetical protein C0Q70_07712 [Pomacea canaliculata]|uniref:Uncharacterized protein n=1 Tax=Pomacea canaliculata TaxID=400727 RepID=A0A2T7PFU2_POMCA|nr:hypothetical protein C0Q70_07712 [Pomacea canaliculata]